MTSLHFYNKTIPGVPVGAPSRFPALRDPIKTTIDSRLDEDDELFINYGMFSDSLPYTMLDDYDLEKVQPLSLPFAVLENDNLRAEFALSLGGRLWRLFDKAQNRDLLTCNQEFLPRNLGIRNAWFAGGIEFNCGRRGHDPNTCQPRFAARLEDPEYGPVLRIYDYSRDRKTPYQMDFFLPADSHFLFARMRIYNPNAEVTPMYWWSNMALPMPKGCRVVVPAATTYFNAYDGGSHFIAKTTMPDGEGFEQTYPEKFPIVRDHFYNIPASQRKYEALFNPDGAGFVHLSTRRLQGRKLFVWGQKEGGKNWQRKLLAKGMCDYLELQAGLAKTQQESLPMQPKTAWEWLEAYGPIQGNPQQIFGSWSDARKHTGALLDQMLPEETMNTMLADTRERIAKRPAEVVQHGDAMAALEELRSGHRLEEHLDFSVNGQEDPEWSTLFREHRFPGGAPSSYQVDPAWKPLVQATADSWKKSYHLALFAFRDKNWPECLKLAQDALARQRNSWTLHLLSTVLGMINPNDDAACKLLVEAALRPEADAYLVKECMKVLNLQKRYAMVLDLFPRLSPKDQQRPTVRLNYASALANTGKKEEALAILLENGGLDLPDAREGETQITLLYQSLAGKDAPIPLPLNYFTK